MVVTIQVDAKLSGLGVLVDGYTIMVSVNSILVLQQLLSSLLDSQGPDATTELTSQIKIVESRTDLVALLKEYLRRAEQGLPLNTADRPE